MNCCFSGIKVDILHRSNFKQDLLMKNKKFLLFQSYNHFVIFYLSYFQLFIYFL